MAKERKKDDKPSGGALEKVSGKSSNKGSNKGSGKSSGKPQSPQRAPLVGIIMGSVSDFATMQEAAVVLDLLDIPFEIRVVSAHRTPDLMYTYAREARARGLEVIIAGAGGAAHLPGMTAALTTLPVIGVPVCSKNLNGLDSLLSIVQMPGGVPVATMAIGNAKNAGLTAARILSIKYPSTAQRLETYVRDMETDVLDARLPRVSQRD